MMPRLPARLPLAVPAEILSRTDVSPAAKLAWMAMASAIGADGLCQASLKALRSVVGLPDRTMRRALGELVRAQLATPVKLPGQPTAWAVHIGEAEKLASAAAAKGGQNGRRPEWPSARMAVGQNGRPALNEINGLAKDPRPERPSAKMTVGQNGRPGPNEIKDLRDARGDNPPPLPHTPSPPIDINQTLPLLDVLQGEAPNGAKRRNLPCTLPPDFAPSERLVAHIETHYPFVDIHRELSAFRLYWLEGKGRGKRKSDWQGAFRVWCEKANDWAMERRLGAVGVAAPGQVRAAPPPPPQATESEGIQRLREIIANARKEA
jgi:hypothetical protein